MRVTVTSGSKTAAEHDHYWADRVSITDSCQMTIANTLK